MRARRITGAALALAVALPCAAAQAAGVTVLSSETLSPRLTELYLSTDALDFPAEVRVLLPDGYDA